MPTGALTVGNGNQPRANASKCPLSDQRRQNTQPRRKATLLSSLEARALAGGSLDGGGRPRPSAT